jgi:hypothetical protein
MRTHKHASFFKSTPDSTPWQTYFSREIKQCNEKLKKYSECDFVNIDEIYERLEDLSVVAKTEEKEQMCSVLESVAFSAYNQSKVIANLQPDEKREFFEKIKNMPIPNPKAQDVTKWDKLLHKCRSEKGRSGLSEEETKEFEKLFYYHFSSEDKYSFLVCKKTFSTMSKINGVLEDAEEKQHTDKRTIRELLNITLHAPNEQKYHYPAGFTSACYALVKSYYSTSTKEIKHEILEKIQYFLDYLLSILRHWDIDAQWIATRIIRIFMPLLTIQERELLMNDIFNIAHQECIDSPRLGDALESILRRVGRPDKEPRCDLFLMPSEGKEKQNSDSTHLRLYKKDGALVYYFKDQEYTFENVEFSREVGNLFNMANLNKNGILKNNHLARIQRRVCEGILAEASIRDHISPPPEIKIKNNILRLITTIYYSIQVEKSLTQIGRLPSELGSTVSQYIFRP